MKIFAPLLAGVLCFSAVSAPEPETPANRLYISNYENVLGTSLEMKFSSASAQAAMQAEQAAIAEIDRLAGVFSAYDNQSEFSRWMRAGLNRPVKVSPQLFDMLGLFEQWKKRSHGALDASAALAADLWKEAARTGLAPRAEALR